MRSCACCVQAVICAELVLRLNMPHIHGKWRRLDVCVWTQEYYNDFVNTPNDIFPVPAVLKIHHYRRHRSRRTRISVSRTDVFARDNFECMYCGCSDTSKLSVDHVLPYSRGGPWTWENLVTACQRCNRKKGARTPAEANMNLRAEPKEPALREFACGNLTPGYPSHLLNPPEEWHAFLWYR